MKRIEHDVDVDIFLIYEELGVSDDGKEPPTARKDLCEFLQIKRRPFIKCFHIIAVHASAQVYLARDLHKMVHGGLLRPAIENFLLAIDTLGFQHEYYSASILIHANRFLRVLNGSAVTKLQSFQKLDFKIPMSRVNQGAVGPRWNSQYTWGVASMNIKRIDLNDLVHLLPEQIQKSNVLESV